MGKWFSTRREALQHKKKLDPDGFRGLEVRKWTYTKRKKPFFLGTELEWLNT